MPVLLLQVVAAVALLLLSACPTTPAASARGEPRADGSFDWDCDGVEEPTLGPQSDLVCLALPPCDGGSVSVTLDCGQSETLTTNCVDDPFGGCAATTSTALQRCR